MPGQRITKVVFEPSTILPVMSMYIDIRIVHTVYVAFGFSHCRIAFIKPSTNSEDKSEIPQEPLIFTNLDVLMIYTNLNDL